MTSRRGSYGAGLDRTLQSFKTRYMLRYVLKTNETRFIPFSYPFQDVKSLETYTHETHTADTRKPPEIARPVHVKSLSKTCETVPWLTCEIAVDT